jgi:hypothetical protein
MQKAAQFQIRKIYAIGNALGITGRNTREDELHALVCGVTGKDSIKELTYGEAGAVIARLEELQGRTASPGHPGKRRTGHTEVPGGITSAQQRKVWALMYELKKYDAVKNDVPVGDRLCLIIRKELKIDAAAGNPFVWVTIAKGDRLIEILKKYVESAKRKAGV